MPPSVKNKNKSDNSLNVKRSTKPLIATPKNQKNFKTSEGTKKYSDGDMNRSSIKSIKRGTKLSETFMEQPNTVEPTKKFNILEILPVNIELEKAIEDIESKGSSSEAEQLSRKSERTREHVSDLDIEQQFILDLDILSDQIILSEEEVEDNDEVEEEALPQPQEEQQPKQEQQQVVKSEPDFFQIIGAVPHMDEVSLDHTDDIIVVKPTALKTVSVPVGDTGAFVDPLTGIRAMSIIPTTSEIFTDEKSLSLVESISDETEKEEDEDEDAERNQDLKEEDPIEEEPIDDFDNVRPSQEIADETFKLFLETVQQKEETQVTDKTELSPKDSIIDNESQNIVQMLLNKLIDHCVTKAEYVDRDIILRNFLDKNKLMRELKIKYDLLELERKSLQFLNRKAVSFFKRKGTFRPITADKGSILTMYRNTYQRALSALDEWLAKEEKTKTLFSTLISELKERLEEAEQQTNRELDKLQQLIKSTFLKLPSASVDKNLSKMSSVRKEISEVRLRLLLQQHEFSSLEKKMERLEDLGNGLTIHDFESLETETAAIAKKIEEYNAALKRIRHYCGDDVHKLAHLKEKQKMTKSVIKAQKHYYAELLQERKELRKYITELKVQRNRYRYEINYLRYRSGILSKPALMKDYDDTVEASNKLRQTNEELKTTIEELNSKIALLEKTCVT